MTPRISILGSIPFLRYTVTFIGGVLLANHYEYQVNLIGLLFFPLLPIVYLQWKWAKAHFSHLIYGISISVLFVGFGYLYTSFDHKKKFSDFTPVHGLFVGRITEKSTTAKGQLKYLVELIFAEANDSSYRLNETILLNTPEIIASNQPELADLIAFSANLYPITSNGNPGEFNYQQFMVNRGIRHQTYLKNKIEILPGKSYTLATWALKLRLKLLNKYRNAGLNGNSFAVLAALTLGEKNYLDSQLKRTFASSGAMHVLAVSGLHVGIIYVILNFLLQPLNRRKARTIKIVVVVILLWGYAFIAGLSPSVLRACTMFTFVAIGENLRRKTNIYNTLALSAFVLVLINPQIIYEVGFQLSYCAVISIVFFQPRIASLLNLQNKILKYLWQLFAVSLAAQIGTFPISIFYFHQFPLYFWLSNFIVIPVAALLLYIAFLFFLTLFMPYVPIILAKVLDFFVRIMTGAVSEIEQLPFAVFKNIWIDKISLLFLILLVVVAGWVCTKKQQKLVFTFLVLSIMFVSNTIYNSIKTKHQQVIVFYNTYNTCLISLIDAKQHYYYTNEQKLTRFSENLLDNCTGYFHTNKSIRVDTLTMINKPIHKHDHFILFKEWMINLIPANENDQMFDVLGDFKIVSNESKIIVKKTNKMRLRTFKKGKLKSFTLLDDRAFNTNEQGALLVLFKVNN